MSHHCSVSYTIADICDKVTRLCDVRETVQDSGLPRTRDDITKIITSLVAALPSDMSKMSADDIDSCVGYMTSPVDKDYSLAGILGVFDGKVKIIYADRRVDVVGASDLRLRPEMGKFQF